MAQHVAVIVDDNVTAGERPAAQAFLDYLLSEAGQQILSLYHFQPASLAFEFPEIQRPLTVENLGGWSWAYTQLVEGVWRTEIEPGLDLDSILRVLNAGE